MVPNAITYDKPNGYEQILRAEGLVLIGDAVDEGENCYYFVSKPCA
jgi:hypothetical protein